MCLAMVQYVKSAAEDKHTVLSLKCAKDNSKWKIDTEYTDQTA